MPINQSDNNRLCDNAPEETPYGQLKNNRNSSRNSDLWDGFPCGKSEISGPSSAAIQKMAPYYPKQKPRCESRLNSIPEEEPLPSASPPFLFGAHNSGPKQSMFHETNPTAISANTTLPCVSPTAPTLGPHKNENSSDIPKPKILKSILKKTNAPIYIADNQAPCIPHTSAAASISANANSQPPSMLTTSLSAQTLTAAGANSANNSPAFALGEHNSKPERSMLQESNFNQISIPNLSNKRSVDGDIRKTLSASNIQSQVSTNLNNQDRSLGAADTADPWTPLAKRVAQTSSENTPFFSSTPMTAPLQTTTTAISCNAGYNLFVSPPANKPVSYGIASRRRNKNKAQNSSKNNQIISSVPTNVQFPPLNFATSTQQSQATLSTPTNAQFLQHQGTASATTSGQFLPFDVGANTHQNQFASSATINGQFLPATFGTSPQQNQATLNVPTNGQFSSIHFGASTQQNPEPGTSSQHCYQPFSTAYTSTQPFNLGTNTQQFGRETSDGRNYQHFSNEFTNRFLSPFNSVVNSQQQSSSTPMEVVDEDDGIENFRSNFQRWEDYQFNGKGPQQQNWNWNQPEQNSAWGNGNFTQTFAQNTTGFSAPPAQFPGFNNNPILNENNNVNNGFAHPFLQTNAQNSSFGESTHLPMQNTFCQPSLTMGLQQQQQNQAGFQPQQAMFGINQPQQNAPPGCCADLQTIMQSGLFGHVIQLNPNGEARELNMFEQPNELNSGMEQQRLLLCLPSLDTFRQIDTSSLISGLQQEFSQLQEMTPPLTAPPYFYIGVSRPPQINENNNSIILENGAHSFPLKLLGFHAEPNVTGNSPICIFGLPTGYNPRERQMALIIPTTNPTNQTNAMQNTSQLSVPNEGQRQHHLLLSTLTHPHGYCPEFQGLTPKRPNESSTDHRFNF